MFEEVSRVIFSFFGSEEVNEEVARERFFVSSSNRWRWEGGWELGWEMEWGLGKNDREECKRNEEIEDSVVNSMRERIISVLGVGVGVGKRVCFRVSKMFTQPWNFQQKHCVKIANPPCTSQHLL